MPPQPARQPAGCSELGCRGQRAAGARAAAWNAAAAVCWHHVGTQHRYVVHFPSKIAIAAGLSRCGQMKRSVSAECVPASCTLPDTPAAGQHGAWPSATTVQQDKDPPRARRHVAHSPQLLRPVGKGREVGGVCSAHASKLGQAHCRHLRGLSTLLPSQREARHGSRRDGGAMSRGARRARSAARMRGAGEPPGMPPQHASLASTLCPLPHAKPAAPCWPPPATPPHLGRRCQTDRPWLPPQCHQA